MDQVKTTVASVVANVMMTYAPRSIGETLHPVIDEAHDHYSVIAVPMEAEERPAVAALFVRCIDQIIIIEEDTFVDEPFHAALMNQGIPREQIILAYRGETIKSQDEA